MIKKNTPLAEGNLVIKHFFKRRLWMLCRFDHVMCNRSQEMFRHPKVSIEMKSHPRRFNWSIVMDSVIVQYKMPQWYDRDSCATNNVYSPLFLFRTLHVYAVQLLLCPRLPHPRGNSQNIVYKVIFALCSFCSSTKRKQFCPVLNSPRHSWV